MLGCHVIYLGPTMCLCVLFGSHAPTTCHSEPLAWTHWHVGPTGKWTLIALLTTLTCGTYSIDIFFPCCALLLIFSSIGLIFSSIGLSFVGLSSDINPTLARQAGPPHTWQGNEVKSSHVQWWELNPRPRPRSGSSQPLGRPTLADSVPHSFILNQALNHK